MDARPRPAQGPLPFSNEVEHILNPYSQLDDRAFWRLAVADRSLFDIANLWSPKFPMRKSGAWATFGSCFAQHLSAALKANGFNWCNFEPAPSRVGSEIAKTFNYGVFSARTGNLYTTSLLLQWVRWALGEQPVPTEVWEAQGRYFDPFRPAIEPGGFASESEVVAARERTLAALVRCLKETQYFVFTLGLTEAWFNRDAGYEYPMCPGTVAGTFDEAQHRFENLKHRDVRDALTAAMKLMRSVNPSMKFILTVSPVPLTATNSGEHVLVATSHSKSVLRSVAGELASSMRSVDYFPSYEIISSPPYRASFFEPNLRSVNPRGVGLVMEHFFAGLATTTPPGKAAKPLAGSSQTKTADPDSDVVCEEVLLDAFSGGPR